MQLDTPLQLNERAAAPRSFVISVEFVAYAALLVFALLLRLAELDTTPLMSSETHNALAAWRVIMPNAPGETLVSTSPIVFVLQSLSFSLFGGSEIAARLFTALGGVALILTPILFRSLVGRTRAFLVSLLLAFSPVLFVASRTSSPDVWALLLAVLSLWAFWRASLRAQTGQNPSAVLAIVLFAALIFLTGTTGPALALILAAAGAVASFWSRRNPLLDDEEPAPSGLGQALRGSIGLALPLAALTVLAVGTGFMLYPSGLSSVGDSIGGAIRAIVQPQGSGGFAAAVGLFYEPVLWLLAVVGLMIRRERLSSADLFLAAWAALAIILSLFFGDNVPDHALWMTVPLAGLAVNSLVWALSLDERFAVVFAPRWARWLIAVCAVGVLAVFTLSFQSTARSMMSAPQGALSFVSQQQPQSLVLLLVSVMFLIIGFFLFASLWGGRTSWQGLILGLAVFGMVTSLGSGWDVAAAEAQNPVELWHIKATNDDTALLRKTLFDVAGRLSRGFPLMPVVVVAPQDGVMAWLLRDFEHTTYITDVQDAANAEVVLLPGTVESPQLGTDYVGQDFTISRVWDTSTMSLTDFPAWWTQHRTRTAWTGEDVIVLWLRQDVYQGVAGQTPSTG